MIKDRIFETELDYELAQAQELIESGKVIVIDGKPGEDYVLTEQDKKDIAKIVEKDVVVPVVEKVTEKVEVVKEQPIITEVVKEVAVTDTPDVIVNKINDSEKTINAERVEGISKNTEDIERLKDFSQKILQIATQRNTGSSGGGTWGSITGTLSDQTDLQTTLNTKQATLVSGTNIKTVNSTSLLGSGNLDVQPLDATLTALAGLNGTAGFVKQTGIDTFTKDTNTYVPFRYVENSASTLTVGTTPGTFVQTSGNSTWTLASVAAMTSAGTLGMPFTFICLSPYGFEEDRTVITLSIPTSVMGGNKNIPGWATSIWGSNKITWVCTSSGWTYISYVRNSTTNPGT